MLVLRKFLKHPQLIETGGAEYLSEFHEGRAVGIGAKTRDEAMDLVSHAHLFVADAELLNVQESVDFGDIALSFPFKTCWFESLTRDGKISFMDFGPESDMNGHVIAPVGILVNETAPDRYDAFVLELAEKRETRDDHNHHRVGANVTVFRNMSATLPEKGSVAWNVHLVLRKYILTLQREAIATETTKETLKARYSNPKRDRFVAPRQIIRILPRKLRDEAVKPLTAGGKVDWSHRWEVRGHWRKVDMIGKDRSGVYCVQGFTWVTPFVKGPEDQPLIQKMRIVANVRSIR